MANTNEYVIGNLIGLVGLAVSVGFATMQVSVGFAVFFFTFLVMSKGRSW